MEVIQKFHCIENYAHLQIKQCKGDLRREKSHIFVHLIAFYTHF